MKRYTTAVVESDMEALGHYELTMALLVDHDWKDNIIDYFIEIINYIVDLIDYKRL